MDTIWSGIDRLNRSTTDSTPLGADRLLDCRSDSNTKYELGDFGLVVEILMARLGDSFSGALRTFGFWLANGTVGLPLLEGIDYSCIFREPSALELTMAIYANVIRVDENGRVLNPIAAEKRAAQWIRSYVDRTYVVDPPFEDWEVALHEPPGLSDIDPDAAQKSN